MRDGAPGRSTATRSDRAAAKGRADRRGQMVIIGALLLATLFVALALIVNAGVYAGVTATERSSGDAGDAGLAYQQTEHVVADARRYVNANHATDHVALVRNLTAALAASERALAGEYATRGASYAISNASTTNRTAIVHDNATRPFTAATGAADWTLADGVVATGTFRLDVARDALAGPDAAGRFRVRITNGSATWTVAVGHDQATGNVTLEVTTDDGSTTCTTTADPARIDATAGTLDGTTCPDLAYAEHVDGPVLIDYENADNATGEYAVNATTTGAVPTTPYAAAPASPHAAYSLSSVTVRHDYRTRTVTHTANVTVP